MPRLMLLSNSTMPGTPFFSWPVPFVRDFLAGAGTSIVFIPYAAVTLSYDAYATVVKSAFEGMGFAITSVHQVADPVESVGKASSIVVGGGNTFALLNRVYEQGLIEVIRQRTQSGIPYLGWSAGANLACPTIKTTNDMPIVQPRALDALGLIPFQINPHYTNYKPEGHGGETRQQRIEEYLVLNDRPVLGLPEGMLVEKDQAQFLLRGTGSATLFRKGMAPVDVKSGSVLNQLLN